MPHSRLLDAEVIFQPRDEIIDGFDPEFDRHPDGEIVQPGPDAVEVDRLNLDDATDALESGTDTRFEVAGRVAWDANCTVDSDGEGSCR